MATMMQRVARLMVGVLITFGATTAGALHAQDVPDVEVMLAVDSSNSMWPAIGATRAAAHEFVSAMPASVRIGVVTFGSEVTVLSPPTADRDLVLRQIEGITPTGDTALYDAVVAATAQFTPDADHKVVVLMSDGRDDGSVNTLDQARAAAGGHVVEAISLTTTETDIGGLSALGRVTPADDATAVSSAFARVADLVVNEVVESATTTTTIVVSTTSMPATTTVPTTAVPTTVAAAPPTPTTVAPPATAASPSPEPSSDPRLGLWAGAAGIFAALFALGLVLFPAERVSRSQLGLQERNGVSGARQRTMSAVDGALQRRGRRDRLATALSVAGISTPPAQFIGVVCVVTLVIALLALALAGPLLAVAVAGALGLGVRLHVQRTIGKRRIAFADQLPDVLQLVTTALRSGFGLSQALGSVSEEAEEPARSEFAHVLLEARLGRDLSDAMRALAERMASKDLEWIVSAIDINRDTGGNLSEVLATVGATIRERQRLARHVMTLTAEGRFSARVLTALPFAMGLLQWRSDPERFANLTHGGGLVALVIAGILLALGSMWVRRIVRSIAL